MESRLRHDLRHPVATISMIASTVVAFTDGLDTDTIRTYRVQVRAEVARLRELSQQNELDLDLSVLESAAEAFCNQSSAQMAAELDDAAKNLILHLPGGMDAAQS